jgi:8-oxo-dGTP diphosphatase
MTYRSVDDIDWSAWTPRQEATLLFIVRDGRVLLIHKKLGLGAGKINGPGGRLEPGETAARAAVREVEEELRIRPLHPEHCGMLSFQFLDGLSLRAAVFKSQEYEGTPQETREAKPLWVTIDAIPYDQMWTDDPLWMPLMLNGTPFEGYFIYDKDRMVDWKLRRQFD